MSRPTRRPGPGLVLALLLASGLALAPPAPAHEPGSHPTGHLKQPEGMTWPPQPLGMSDVRDLSDPRGEARRQARETVAFRRLAERLAADPALRAYADRPMTRLGVVERRGPDGAVEETRYEFFDRAQNATVAVVQTRTGRLRLETIPAARYQPEIVRAEEREAVALAKRHLVQRGWSRAGELRGYAILAYRPDGSGFYDGRVLYVSLHASRTAPPEFVAWVDLTRQRVFGARREPAR